MEVVNCGLDARHLGVGHWCSQGTMQYALGFVHQALEVSSGHWSVVLALRSGSAHSPGTGDGKLPLLATKPNQMPYKRLPTVYKSVQVELWD